jgi:pimeloyl-ACP methyl ester carboxylesterase
MLALAAVEAAALTTLRVAGFRTRWSVTRQGRVRVIEGRGGGRGDVIFVHGLASSATSFAPTMFRLSPHFARLVAFDLPGHGTSPPPRGRFGAGALLSSVEDVLSSECRGPVTLIGNSLGAGLALRFALSHPERVLGLVMTSPAGALLSESAVRELLGAFRLSNVADGFALLDRLHHRRVPFAKLFARDLLEVVQARHLRELVAALEAAPSFTPEELRSLVPPAMLIWGRSDRLMPPSAYEFFRDHLPSRTELLSLAAVGHSPHVEAPKRFANALVPFLRRIPR